MLPIDGALVGAPLYLLLRLAYARGWSRRARRLAAIPALAAALVCFLLLIGPTMRLIWASASVRGTGVAADEYRGRGPSLPASASKITYYSDPRGADAVFATSEEALVDWARRNALRLAEIEEETTVRLGLLGTVRTVSAGLVGAETLHPRGTGVSLTFDREGGLCYYRYLAY